MAASMSRRSSGEFSIDFDSYFDEESRQLRTLQADGLVDLGPKSIKADA